MPYQKPEPGHPILIEIDGRKLELRYSLGTLKQLDKAHGISVFKGEQMATVFQEPAAFSTVLFFGLYEKQPDITQEWLDANITSPMIIEMVPMLIFATTGKWRGEEPAPASPNGAGPGTTGSPSGPSEDMTLVLVSETSGA